MAFGRQVVLALLGCLLWAAPASAQNPGTLTGRVVDGATQQPLAGVAVRVAERGTQTGADGRFTVAGVPAGTYTVRATRVGYREASQPVTIAAGQTAAVELRMSSDAVQLEGLVVVGYGEQEQRDITGSVQSVTPEEFNTGRVVSAEQLIQAKVAGVQVVDSGEPGAEVKVRIRGGTSLNASNEPLFVVDGVPLAVGGGLSAGRNPLNFLNPDDIESMTVLKDASATAIYGSRGANGVIIVTTKRGTSGPQFSYNGSVSTSRVTRSPDLLGADEFRAAVAEYAPSSAGMLGTASTDWRDAVQRDATGQDHSLAVGGSSQNMSYRLSVGWLDQTGVVEGSATERISAALNYNQRLFGDRLSVQANLRGARTDDEFTPIAVLGAATAFAPTQPIFGAGGQFFEWEQNQATNNPLAELALVSDEGRTTRGIGNLEARYQLPFLEGLSATGRLGFDVAEAERMIFSPRTLRAQIESGDSGTVERRTPSRTATVFESFVNYVRPLDRWDSQVDLTVGYSYEQARGDSASFIARRISSDLLGPDGVPAAGRVIPLIRVDETRLASGFARLNYSLKDRYLLALSVRRDGSSKFGPDNQWGTFPSAALAWRVSDEPFMDRFDALSDLKLRASWGINGNQSFDSYLWAISYLLGTAETQVQFGDRFVSTIRPSSVDPDIKWEETTSWNLGVDYGLFDDRITGTLDFYVKDTDDLIFNAPVAGGTNLSNVVTTNVGSMRNSGVELGLNASILKGGREGLSWDASFNAAHNRNRVTTIYGNSGGTEKILSGDISGGVGNRVQVLQPGQPAYSFFVYRHRRDAEGRPLYEDRDDDGDIDETDLYEDLNGDGIVNQADRAAFENPAPDWIFGHSSNLAYRSFDLSFTLRANLGNHVYNNVASNLGHFAALTASGAPNNLHSSALEYGFETPQYFSDIYVEDASFLRMDNLTLGYTFAGLRRVDSLRLFGTVQNVFTLTGYDGLDPMAGINGIDNNIYPRSRTFTAGVSIGF